MLHGERSDYAPRAQHRASTQFNFKHFPDFFRSKSSIGAWRSRTLRLYHFPDKVPNVVDVFDNFTLLCCCQGSRSRECSSHCKIFAMFFVHDDKELFFRKLSSDPPYPRSHDVRTSDYVWNGTHVNDDPWQRVEGGSIG